MKLKTTIFLFIVLFYFDDVASHSSDTKSDLIVKTTGGRVKGERIKNLGVTYYSYKGIPYAKHPIDKLRYKDPLPRTWKGVRDATIHGYYCLNKEGFLGFPKLAGGSEMCLYLNIYTPSLNGSRAVMFLVHSGSFSFGNGDSYLFGPEYIVGEDVILVTINFRLSSFGFLSTNDNNAQGNQGLKDIIMALQFVKENIWKFGGDPNKVTIFGQSAGAQIVSLFLMTDLTDGLFQQAIMQSGNALSMVFPDVSKKASDLGDSLRINYKNSEDLIRKLRKTDEYEIIQAERRISKMDRPFGMAGFDFTPNIESSNSLKPRVLTDTPINLLKKGKIKKIPIMAGINNFDGSIASTVLSNPKTLDEYNSQPKYRIPFYVEGTNSLTSNFALTFIDNQYFQKSGSLLEWQKFYTDIGFKYPLHNFLKHYVSATSPAYVYEFSFVGSINFAQMWYKDEIAGACHGDDGSYLFNMAKATKLNADTQSQLIRSRMVKMWTNFAKFGNPTPQKTTLLPEIWTPYTVVNREYLKIGKDLANQKNPANVDFWMYLEAFQDYIKEFFRGNIFVILPAITTFFNLVVIFFRNFFGVN